MHVVTHNQSAAMASEGTHERVERALSCVHTLRPIARPAALPRPAGSAQYARSHHAGTMPPAVLGKLQDSDVGHY